METFDKLKERVRTVYLSAKPYCNAAYNGLRAINGLPKKEERNIFNYVEVGLSLKNVVDTFQENLNRVEYVDPYYEKAKYITVTTWKSYRDILHENLMKQNPQFIKSFVRKDSYSDRELKIFLLPELNIHFVVYEDHKSVNDLLVTDKTHIPKIREFLSDKIWQELGCNFVQYSATRENLEPLKIEELQNTPQSEKLVKECRSYLESDINRSILFCGPPGSGKSHLIKKICHQLGLKSLKLSIRELKSEYAMDIINLLKPAVLVIDDIDHGIEKDQAGLDKILNVLEDNKLQTKLVLASANVAVKLDPALQRPGRFDEVIEINFLDRETHRKLVNNDDDLYKFTANFPAAYVVEFMKRVKIKGKDQALQDSEDLLLRVGNFKNYNYELKAKDLPTN
jgi:cytidylate kinase